MDNFDLKNYLAENKLLKENIQSRLNENNEENEFLKLLKDLEVDLVEYDGDEIVYEEDPDSMEVGITIFPDYRKRNKEILKAINDIVKKNTNKDGNPLFMIPKTSVNRERDEEGVTLTFDIIKK